MYTIFEIEINKHNNYQYPQLNSYTSIILVNL